MSSFFWRRVHSLMGLWLIIYLIEHLIVNSQAVLWIGEDGAGFVRLVNSLESLPYLQVIEVLFIGVPLVVHGIWGMKRAYEAKMSRMTDKRYSWQRITSWILLFAIVGHVVQMRFVEMPKKVKTENGVVHVVTLKRDPKVEALAERIHVALDVQGDVVVATAQTPGKAMLLMVRETFKNPWMCWLYTIFVLSACFHAFNGLWTAMITWGVLLSAKSQRAFLPVCWGGVGVLTFLGLAAIWGSAWS